MGLVGSGLYPGSMVGVPGETSNMAPPTMCIVALLFFQAGIIEIIRPWVQERLIRPGWATTNDVINRFSLPLFLFHSTGMALSKAFGYWLLRQRRAPSRPDPRLVAAAAVLVHRPAAVHAAGDLPVRPPVGEATGSVSVSTS